MALYTYIGTESSFPKYRNIMSIKYRPCPANNDPWFHKFCKWIHEFSWLNSCEFTGFCEQIWCVDTCLPWNHEFFTWKHMPVKPYEFWPTRVKLVQNSWQQAEHMYSHEYMKTCTGGAVPIMNQYDTCQLVQKWFLLCWVVLETSLTKWLQGQFVSQAREARLKGTWL